MTLGAQEAVRSCTLFTEKMARVSSRGSAPLNLPPTSSSDPPGRVFSDDELSEIFQIDFGQIFGNPEAGLKSSYKGIQSKKGVSRSNSSSRTGTVSDLLRFSFAVLLPPYTTGLMATTTTKLLEIVPMRC